MLSGFVLRGWSLFLLCMLCERLKITFHLFLHKPVIFSNFISSFDIFFFLVCCGKTCMLDVSNCVLTKWKLHHMMLAYERNAESILCKDEWIGPTGEKIIGDELIF